MTTETAPQPLIVVGVDGSLGSQRAVDWATDYARLCEGSLELVSTWTRATYGLPPMMVSDNPEPVARAAVDKASVGSQLERQRVRTEVIEGPPGPFLVRRAAEAALLVVGSRGLGGVGSALLGSVSTYCVHHAICPVVVVR